LSESFASSAPGWIWIPIAFAAAAAQTVRNAAQRSLTKSAGIFPATFVRFFYGLPFAVLAFAAIIVAGAASVPQPGAAFFAWLSLGAIAQLVATAFLVAAMEQRSFVVAVVYSKTEIIQIGIYSVAFLGEALSAAAICAIALSTAGVVLLSGKTVAERESGLSSWISPGAMLGLAAGAGFALSAVGYRGAFLALAHPQPWVAGTYSVVWAQTLQVLLLGGYLLVRDRRGLKQVLIEWRVSSLAGLMGTLASIGWLTAYAMRSAVDVRIAGLVEVIYSYALSRRFFAERVSRMELLGIVLVVVGIVMISVAR
jgi:drug/metabolite transporter (DMT)-like permease